MFIIENNSANLIRNIPKEVLSKLGISGGVYNSVGEEFEVTILFGERLEAVMSEISKIGGEFKNLGYGFGIVTISKEKIIDLLKIEEIQYIELPKSLYYTDVDSNRAACIDVARSNYNLQGEGVLVGFIDTGIDYTHPAFLREDGTTRIEYIYDLTLDKIFDKSQINQALSAQDPYSVVPSYDSIEHGTHVAGIACAGGKIDPKYYGVAPKSSIIMVKSGRGLFSLSTNILKGIKFLVDKGIELNMPVAINISLSTNDGAHNGTSLLEQYIGTIAKSERVTISIAAGNEGEAGHHKGEILKKETRINFEVGQDETTIVMNLYKSVLPEVSIELVAPTGVSSGEIVLEEGYKEGFISRNKYQFFYTGPRFFDITGEIGISLINNGNNIISGTWTLILRVINEYEGDFDIWLPISEGINKSTKFLEPTIQGTLGIPATVPNVISVGSYNYRNKNISPFSGRGRIYPLYFETKPDLVAPGEGIMAPVPDKSFDVKSGTSMATPHVTGIAALMMEWGILKGNDRYLFGERLKYYLILGANKGRKDIDYPDISWGYGEVCLYNSLDLLSNVLNIPSNRIGNRQYSDIGRYKSVQQYIDENINGDEIVSVLVEYNYKEDVKKIKSLPNTIVIELSQYFSIVNTPINQMGELKKIVKEIDDIYDPQIFTLSDISPIDASNVIEYQTAPYLKLNGRGVIIGIIDTGIDYLNNEFQKEDGTTRIISLWDQSIEGEPKGNVEYGKEFTEEDINKAIETSRSGGDPYSIVPSKDNIGHGTRVASIAAARGNNKEVIGVAPQSELIVVKLKNMSQEALKYFNITVPNVLAYNHTEVLTALNYIYELSAKENKPVVFLLPLESNIGSHDGLSFMAVGLDRYTTRANTAAVTGTGNEGNTDTHTEGVIENQGDSKNIELRVGKNQNTISFKLWVNKPDVYSISVTSPSGEIFTMSQLKSNKVENFKFSYEQTLMEVRYNISNRYNGDESILIRAVGIKEGIWKFTLYGDYVVNGKYFTWLPQRQLLDTDTKFLSPSQYSTLSDQSTSINTISVAYYDQNNNTIVGASGRGYTRNGVIKPDIAAGGINAKVINPGGTIGTASGSSVATAIVAGIVADILQWASVEGNKPNISPKEVLSYIIRGAKMRPGDDYPNREWGYGMVDLEGIVNIIRGQFREEIGYREYNINNLFVRLPIVNKYNFEQI